MKLTKLAHASVIVEDQHGSKVVVDPGEYTDLPADLASVEAVVFTHMHGDHASAANLQSILSASPQAVLYAHAESLALVGDIACRKVELSADLAVTAGAFQLRFNLVDHAVIWQTSPCSNFSVQINDFYYYPGDSFRPPASPVEIAGVPVWAPWLKVAESIVYMRQIQAGKLLPVHDALLTESGNEIVRNWLRRGVEGIGAELLLLAPGKSYEGR